MDRLIGNEDTIKKHIMVLNILSSYTRSFPPNKDEFQIYLEISIDNNKLDELIEVCLIFIYLFIIFIILYISIRYKYKYVREAFIYLFKLY